MWPGHLRPIQLDVVWLLLGYQGIHLLRGDEVLRELDVLLGFTLKAVQGGAHVCDDEQLSAQGLQHSMCAPMLGLQHSMCAHAGSRMGSGLVRSKREVSSYIYK